MSLIKTIILSFLGFTTFLISLLIGVSLLLPKNPPLNTLPDPSPTVTKTSPSSSYSSFQCRGKTRCPQMVSCEEAMFYLRNCPGVEIDGDNDGIPCEGQWCGH